MKCGSPMAAYSPVGIMTKNIPLGRPSSPALNLYMLLVRMLTLRLPANFIMSPATLSCCLRCTSIICSSLVSFALCCHFLPPLEIRYTFSKSLLINRLLVTSPLSLSILSARSSGIVMFTRFIIPPIHTMRLINVVLHRTQRINMA